MVPLTNFESRIYEVLREHEIHPILLVEDHLLDFGSLLNLLFGTTAINKSILANFIQRGRQRDS
jgi:hypothetical protein